MKKKLEYHAISLPETNEASSKWNKPWSCCIGSTGGSHSNFFSKFDVIAMLNKGLRPQPCEHVQVGDG